MPLTPQDVSNKTFTMVRMRGYAMGEVDEFLDEVETELGRLLREIDELRAELEVAQGSPRPPEAVSAPAPEPQQEPEPTQPSAEVAPEPPTAPEPAPTPVLETLRVTTTAEASAAATRLLELAGQNADQLVGEASAEAQRIRSEAQSAAETLEGEARGRAENLDAETAERRERLLGELEEEKSRLGSEIDGLRAFEREYRAELRTYFEEQIAALDGQGTGGLLHHGEPEGDDTAPTPPPASEEPRLQELLDEPYADQ